MNIEVKYPAIVVTENYEKIDDESILAECNGKKDETSELYRYLNDELLDLGVTSGSVEVVLDSKSNNLFSKVTYLSPRKLNKSQLGSLVAETSDQMLDGYGEQPWSFSFDGKNYNIILCSELASMPASVEQTESIGQAKSARRSPIFTAISKRDIEKIRKYYKHNHFEQFCQYGYPPLWHAISEQLHDIAIEMIEAGAPVRFKKNTLLSACAMNHSYDHPKLLELAKLIICKGVDVNQASASDQDGSSYGYTALMWAANRGKRPLVELLLKYGADVNLQSEYGDTALSIASPEHLDIVRCLLEAGAKPDILNSQYRNAVSESLWQAKFRDVPVGLGYNPAIAEQYRQKAALIMDYMEFKFC